MKKILILLVLISFGSVAYAQNAVIYRTTHLNIGFGKTSNVSSNEYMDFCVNGPLVGPNNLPVGGYIDNGIQKQNWVTPDQAGGNFAVDNSIFGLGFDGYLYMIPVSKAHTLPNMKWAFQNGPMLVQNGQNVRGSSQSKFVRSGMGYTPEGEVIVIITTDPVTFYEFANMFVKEGCQNAIYLDGDRIYVGYADEYGNHGMVKDAIKLQFFNN